MSQDSSQESSEDEDMRPSQKKNKIAPPLDDEEHDLADRLFQDALHNAGSAQVPKDRTLDEDQDVDEGRDNTEGNQQGDEDGGDNEDIRMTPAEIGPSIFEDNGVFSFLFYENKYLFVYF